MKPKTIPRWALGALVLLAAVTLVSSVALARPDDDLASSETALQPDTTLQSGGRYKLINVSLGKDGVIFRQANEILSGGAYRLERLPNLQLAEDICCCLYMPCVVR